jgi:D-methionine transport system ATP-binding protein
MISIKNVSKAYQQGKQLLPALHDINITIPEGEIFGIIGRSGAGKSTLVRCINLLERPDQGRIIVNHTDLTQLNAKALRLARRQIGKIFQHFNLLESRNVFDNIALPLELVGTTRKAIVQTLTPLIELVGLHNKERYYPHQLSGGQKQRVAIARALAAKPKVLLCDEATSALDPETTQNILNLLKDINRHFKLTIVLVTHEMEVLKAICQRAAVLDHGQCVEQGSVLDLFTNPQQEVTRRLTQSTLNVSLPESITSQLRQDAAGSKALIVKLTFVGESTKRPVISDIHDRFQVTTSILQADLQTISDAPFGVTICQLGGTQKAIEQALAYLQQQQINTQVLGYV